MTNPLSDIVGVAGVLVAALGAWNIYRINKRDAATSELTELVYAIGYKSWSVPEQGNAGLIFLRFHAKLWSKYTSLRKHIWFWKRRSLDKSWREYIGQDHYDEIPDDLMGKLFFQGIPVSREDAVKRSEKFIRHLQKLR